MSIAERAAAHLTTRQRALRFGWCIRRYRARGVHEARPYPW